MPQTSTGDAGPFTTRPRRAVVGRAAVTVAAATFAGMRRTYLVAFVVAGGGCGVLAGVTSGIGWAIAAVIPAVAIASLALVDARRPVRDGTAVPGRNADGNRHRVAAATPGDAVPAGAGFVAFPQAAAASPATARHVHARRDLVATTPRHDRLPNRSLGALAATHLDGLYGHTPAPRLDVAVAEGVAPTRAVEAALVRLTQQALDAVAARGGATAIAVTVAATSDALVLTVTDDGDPPPTEAGHAHHLATMHVLAASVGGWFDANHPAGTRVVLHPGMAAAPTRRPRHHLHLAATS